MPVAQCPLPLLLWTVVYGLLCPPEFASNAGGWTFSTHAQGDVRKACMAVLKDQILVEATWALQQEPVTVTASTSPRSAGGKHDFYSEADYWWPDPANPGGPYIQRDGQSNPDNFVAHRHAMIRFSKIVGALGSAYLVTLDDQYVAHAWKHARAWFVDTATRMNPSLLYAQAIGGKVTGRSIGVIDTIHLMEVAQGLRVMERSPASDKALCAAIKNWFSEYLLWLTTHPYGKEEMAAENNHGTCWVMQVAAFAKFAGNRQLIQFCRDRYKTVLLAGQMAADGSFPRELKRTKPYGYSLFNLDAMATLCQILSDSQENLWTYTTPDGRNIGKGISYLFPYVQDKNKWPLAKDVMYWNQWPVAHPFLVFGAGALHQRDWMEAWKRLEHSPAAEEVVRNLPVRNPLIWFE
jgi:hypothetical protein